MNYLLLDATYLCHRARFSTGGLSYGGDMTGVAYGVLRDVEGFKDQFGGDRVVWAFDYGGPGKRAEIFPDYKKHRRNKEMTDEEQEELHQFQKQVLRLRSSLLPKMGYRNVFCERGYEADDIIAKVAEELPLEHDAVIVTGDNDLWQCLKGNVVWYSPASKKLVTRESFAVEWGLRSPILWAQVKAIAGCSTDGVPGVRGVGDKTAAKYVSGWLREGKKYDSIVQNLSIQNRNLRLVRLPLPGLELPELRSDEVTKDRTRKVKEELGIRTGKRERDGFPV